MNCLCCKAMDHEVLDYPRIIARHEKLNIEKAKPKGDQETKIIPETQKESEKILLQMKDTLNDYRHVRLSEIFKENEKIKAIVLAISVNRKQTSVYLSLMASTVVVAVMKIALNNSAVIIERRRDSDRWIPS
jgi:hypothetical protein